MPWVEFTAAQIIGRMSVREQRVYLEASGKPSNGEDAPPAEPRMAEVVTQVCDQFRGAIMANPRVTFLGPAGTLPAFCIGYAAVLGRTALLGLPPVEEGKTDARRDEYDTAKDFLKSLSSMDPKAFALEEPIAPQPNSSPSYGGKPLLDF